MAERRYTGLKKAALGEEKRRNQPAKNGEA